METWISLEIIRALVLDVKMDTSNSLESLYFIACSIKLTFMSTKTSEALF